MTGDVELLPLEEVDQRIRDMSLRFFRETPNFRVYFSNIYPHMKRTMQMFGLKGLWDEAYERALGGDFEVDRVALLLGTLYEEDREKLRELMQYIVNDATSRMVVHQPEIDFVLQELKRIGIEVEVKD